MYRRILVPLDPSPYTTSALQHALTLAQKHGATVTGQVVLDVPEISAPATMVSESKYDLFPLDLEQQKLADAKKHIDALITDFTDRCAAAGIPGDVARMQGVPAKRILEVASYHDLVVMGLRTYFHFETRTSPGDSLHKVLTHSPIPVLATPKRFQELRHIVLAYDGSFHSVSTLHKLARFAPPLDAKILILTSQGHREQAEESLTHAKEFLESHNCTSVNTRWTNEPITEALSAEEIGCPDLIAAGVHTRHPMRDIFIGSFTKAMIKKDAVPLFLGL